MSRRLERGLLLRGNIPDLSVPDLVQVLVVARKSGVVRLRWAGVSGSLHVQGGTLVDAEVADLSGRAAALELLGWREGTFEVVFGDVDRVDRIGQATASLLMTAMVAMDEANRLRPTSAPAAARRRIHPGLILGALALGVTLAVVGLAGASDGARAAARPARPAPIEGRMTRPVARPAAPTSPFAAPAFPRPPEHWFLVIRSTPPGAEVFVAGRSRGTTPARIDLGRLTGEVAVRMVLAGHLDWVGRVAPGRGWEVAGPSATRTIDVALRDAPAPDPPTVVVDSLPAGARQAEP